MSLIKKLKLITLGRIEAFLDSLEQPEYILPQLQKELAQKLDLAIKAQVKSLAAVRSANNKLDEINGRILRLEQLAQSALQADKEDLALQALAAGVQAEEQKKLQEQNLGYAQNAYVQAAGVRQQLQNSLNQLKLKVQTLKQRNIIVKQQKQLTRDTAKVDLFQGQSILDAVARMESEIEEETIETEVHNEIYQAIGFELNDDFLADLQKKEEIQRRLAQMKKKL